jgi:hypothetical protein
MLIQMLPDVRWVGFLPPLAVLMRKVKRVIIFFLAVTGGDHEKSGIRRPDHLTKRRQWVFVYADLGNRTLNRIKKKLLQANRKYLSKMFTNRP